MSKWIKAEDAPDFIPDGAQIWIQKPEWKYPEMGILKKGYDRRSEACGGYFYMLFEYPEPPKYE